MSIPLNDGAANALEVELPILRRERDQARRERDEYRKQLAVSQEDHARYVAECQQTHLEQAEVHAARVGELEAECRARLEQENHQRARADAAEAASAAIRSELDKAHACGRDPCASCDAIVLAMAVNDPGAALLEELRALRAKIAAGDVLADAARGMFSPTTALGPDRWETLENSMRAYDAAKVVSHG